MCLNNDNPLPIDIGNINPVEKNIIALIIVINTILIFIFNDRIKQIKATNNKEFIKMDNSRKASYFFNKERQIKVDAKYTMPKLSAKCPKKIGL